MTQVSLYLFSLLFPFFPFNISVTPKMVIKVIINLDLSQASGPDCISVVVPRKCEPELSYILAEFFNKCPKESCFPDGWKNKIIIKIIIIITITINITIDFDY